MGCIIKPKANVAFNSEIAVGGETTTNLIKTNLEKEYKLIKDKNNNYYQDIKAQNDYVENSQSYVNEIKFSLEKIKLGSNISILNCNENNMQFNQLKNEISSKISEIFDLLEFISNKNFELKETINYFQNFTIRKIECIQEEIQASLNEINKITEKKKNNIIIPKSLNKLLNIHENIIKKNLSSIKETHEIFEEEKKTYEDIKKEIENKITNIKNLDSILKEKDNSLKSNKKNLLGSLLTGVNIELIATKKDLFNSLSLFNDEKNKPNESKSNLLHRNWHEICEIYEDYDLHEINFELLAVGLQQNSYYNKSSIGFYYNTLVEILEFEIDGKKSNYTYQNYSLNFDIHLENKQFNKIHLKYKESELLNKEGDKKERKFYRQNYYGLSKSLEGQIAKFILKIKCDFEIISFEDEFFIKNEDKYEWGGEVPIGGKRTLVQLSKKEAKWSFNIKHRIESTNGSNLKSTRLTVPIVFEGGNNQILNLNTTSNQTNNIEKNNNSYVVSFKNTNSNIGEFIIQGKLINKCKGIWECNFTDEEIEKSITEDVKRDKQKFEEIAKNIIGNYNENNKNKLIIITDIAKIGKWVKNNINYDLNYSGNRNITAMEIYNIKKGVCEHFTKLFNALIYSLGFKVIKVTGFAVSKNDFFTDECLHTWSLIKVYDDWLPFDATWGFFSGKLPVCHIFCYFFNSSRKTNGTDTIQIMNPEESGKLEE